MKNLMTLLIVLGIYGVMPETHFAAEIASDENCQCGSDEDGECLPCEDTN